MAEQGGVIAEFSYDIEDLLERMAVETFPEIIESGQVVGREVW